MRREVLGSRGTRMETGSLSNIEGKKSLDFNRPSTFLLDTRRDLSSVFRRSVFGPALTSSKSIPPYKPRCDLLAKCVRT